MERHVILTLGRSGSNTLVNLLNQHPDLLNVGEVLGPWNRVRQVRDKLGLYPDDTAGYLDALTRRSRLVRSMSAVRTAGRLVRLRPGEVKPLGRIRTLGFKEFATLMAADGQRGWLRDRPDVKVVGLVRDDILGRLVSWQLLDRTGVVANRDGAAADKPVLEIAPDRIAALLDTVAAENRLLTEMLEELPARQVRILRYDDFYADEARRQAMIADVFSFLGLRPWRTEIRMKKIVTVPPAQMIANRAACAQALQGSRFEGLLDA
ncbi:hypothetical protein [Roseovarius sp. SYSU LYC5161]|uniref:hypothetical protein n=1 Tax=Roseovarius halophilus (ex Wu et al. 2025) TaxID=3376060 RepID=UPI00399B8334